MRTFVRLGSMIGLLMLARVASAAPYDFSAGSWIIPMDVCYQPSKPFNGAGSWGSASTSTIYTSGCPDTSGTAYDGVLKAYGLVYRLLQNNIPVYYILDQTKTSVDDDDLTITNSGTTPVALLNHTTGASTEFMNATHTSITYRGAPFIISAADVPNALNLLKTNSAFTVSDTRTGHKVFQDVYIHVAKTNILQAPVRAILLQVPPKIALLDIGGAAIGVLQGYLQDAGLFTSTSTAVYPTIGDVFTQFQQPTDFTGGGLTTGGFSILWAPHWEGDQITTTQRDGVMKAISNFVDAGHPFLAQCAALVTFEGGSAVNTSGYGGQVAPDTTYSHFITTASINQSGLKTNQISQSSAFPASGAQKILVNPSTTTLAYLDPLTQIGDYTMNLNELSWTFDFTPAAGYAYKPGVKSYVQTSSTSPTSYNGLQIETVTNKDNDPSKGLVIYLGGHSYGSLGSTCSGTCSTFNQLNVIGLERLVLNSLVFLGQIPTSTEQTRSSPIVVTGPLPVPQSLVGKTYLGSYVQQSAATATYPPWTGHFRQYPSGNLVGTNVTGFNAITSDWDAYDHVKIQGASDSRTIFTSIGGARVDFTTANLTTIKGACSSATAAIITSIRTGVLGGIDHSIPAVIPPSLAAGNNSRPTVAYFGALDGMVHAILLYSQTSIGKNPGDELWGFIPPSQLCKVIGQTAGVDGSASVSDAFVGNGAGINSWRTLLAIPDGNYAGGTLDVLDVTDPTTPKFMWEAADSFTSAGKTYVLGRAQGAAASPIITTNGVRFAYFMATDNTNGSAGNGFNMYGLDAGTGAVIWRYNHTYVNDTTHNDVPGTVAVIDDTGQDAAVDADFFGDIEGKVWKVQAATGLTPTMLYDAAVAHSAANSVNYPIESGLVLFRDPVSSHLDVLGVTSGADWVPSSTLSYVFKLDTTTSVAVNEATLGSGERAYAVPTIFGNQAYIITSLGALQSAIGSAFTASGNLLRVNLGSTPGVTTLATVRQGASEVAVDGSGNVIAASASGITENGNTGRDATVATALQNGTPKLMKVRAWLDWH